MPKKRILVKIDESLHPRTGERGSLVEGAGLSQALHLMSEVMHSQICRCSGRKDLQREGRFFHVEGSDYESFRQAYDRASLAVLEVKRSSSLPWAIDADLELRSNRCRVWHRTFVFHSQSGACVGFLTTDGSL